eukprot:11167675-Lingulodinium_polyedra.AAC.1
MRSRERSVARSHASFLRSRSHPLDLARSFSFTRVCLFAFVRAHPFTGVRLFALVHSRSCTRARALAMLNS